MIAIFFTDTYFRVCVVHKREEIQEQHPDVDWHIAMMPGQHPCQGRAPVSGDQVPVRPSQGALSGLVQEYQSVAGDVCAEQPVDGAQTDFAGVAGMSAPAAWAKARNRAPTRQKNEKSAAIQRWFHHLIEQQI